MGTLASINVGPRTVEWSGSALGFTEGDLELIFEEQMVDITAHEEGTNVLTSIRTGKSVEITVAMKETNKAMIKYILGQGGASVTASGAASAVTAWGGSKDFTQVATQAGKLVLHKANTAASDKSEDIAVWKAYPMLDSLTFSGENNNLMNITFRCYPDLSLADEARLLVYGDHTDGNFSSVS